MLSRKKKKVFALAGNGTEVQGGSNMTGTDFF